MLSLRTKKLRQKSFKAMIKITNYFGLFEIEVRNKAGQITFWDSDLTAEEVGQLLEGN